MDDAQRIDTVKRYLRRTYGAGTATPNLNGLKALADQVAQGLGDEVTIIGQTFEGGSSQGQVTFERLAYLTAVEELIAEIDPTGTPPEWTNVTRAQFGGRFFGV